MEFFKIFSRVSRRTLYRCRSILFNLQVTNVSYKPDVILAIIKINKGKFIAENVIKSLIKSGEKIKANSKYFWINF